MEKDRSDFAVMNRMIDRIRLLIAIDDEEISIKKKLEVQAILKDFQLLLGVPAAERERVRIKGYYDILWRELGEQADVAALLSSLRNYIEYV